MIPQIAIAIVTEMPKGNGITPRAVAATDMPKMFPIRKQIGPFMGYFLFRMSTAFGRITKAITYIV